MTASSTVQTTVRSSGRSRRVSGSATALVATAVAAIAWLAARLDALVHAEHGLHLGATGLHTLQAVLLEVVVFGDRAEGDRIRVRLDVRPGAVCEVVRRRCTGDDPVDVRLLPLL